MGFEILLGIGIWTLGFDIMTILQTLKFAIAELKTGKITDDPNLEAEILLSYTIKKSREFILAHGEKKLTARQAAAFKSHVSQRLKGAPIAYIIGHKEFYGLDFKVNQNVLIPRPETEMMVEEALRLATRNPQPVTFVDVGTGSGCIIITLAKLLNQESRIMNHKLWGIDISKKALAVARQNAKTHGVDKKIKFVNGNLLSPLIPNSRFLIPDSNLIILANLPYLTPSQIKNSPSIKSEPKQALAGGPDGLNLYRKLAGQIKRLPGYKITLLCEFNPAQAKAMKKIFSFAKEFHIKKDLCGLNRLALILII